MKAKLRRQTVQHRKKVSLKVLLKENRKNQNKE